MTRYTTIVRYKVAAWLVLLFAGCQYEPDGEFFNEIGINKIEIPVIRLRNNSDSVSLIEETGFSYSINTSREHVQTEVYFDSQRIDFEKGNANNQGYFTIDPHDYEEGEHELTIKTITGSGTGSLIDKLNAEHIESEKTWSVIIERLKPVNITNVSVHDGSILVEWETYQPLILEKFSHYEISYREGYDKVVLNVKNPDVTSVYDTSFTSGVRVYQINVVTEHHTIPGETFRFYRPNAYHARVNFQISLSNDTLKMYWNRPELYRNINSFRVRYCCDSRGDFVTASVEDTSFQTIANMRFGIDKHARLIYDDNYGISDELSNQNVFVGNKLDQGGQLFFNPVAQSYYQFVRKEGLSQRYDADLIGREQYPSHKNSSYYSRYQMSFNGEFAYELTTSAITRLDPANLAELQSYDTKALLGLAETVDISGAFVSNNNVMTIVLRNNRSFVFDMNDTTLLKEFATAGELTLSPNGIFLIAADTLYQRDGQGYIPTSVIEDISNSPKSFSNIQPYHLILGKQSAIKVYDCQILSYVNSIALPNDIDFVSVDPYRNLVGGYKARNGTFHLVDLDDESVRVTDIFATQSRTYFLLNGILFSKNGFYLKLAK